MKFSSDWIYLAAQEVETSRRIDGASTRDTDASTFKKLAMMPSIDWIYTSRNDFFFCVMQNELPGKIMSLALCLAKT
jgi:hypothetical protein